MSPNITEKPPAKKPGRRRIACVACSSNKQKCDGATRHPCRRCELYGLSCEYPGGEIPKTAVRVDPASTNSAGPSSVASSVAGGSGAGNGDIAAALREMTARLAAIEAGLDSDRRNGLRPAASSSSFAPPISSTALRNAADSTAAAAAALLTSSSTTAHPHNVELPVETNPLQVLVSTMEQMSRDEAAANGGSEMDEMEADDGQGEGGDEKSESLSYLEQLAWKARSEPRSSRCDAFARGLVTLEDVNAAFGFYTQRIQPWIPVVEKRPALVVREKSPFFFHIILLVTNYYNTSTSARAREVYNGLNDIVHGLLVRHILAPDPSMFNRDFVRALLLLLYYKPVQNSYAERGLKSSSRIVHASKVNALSSLMIHALIRQASGFLGMHQAPLALSVLLEQQASSSSSDSPPAALEQALIDFRTWCSVISADALGSLQNGRTTWTDPAAALRVARRFAALASDPTDVRRAAMLELYSIVTVPRPPTLVAPNPVRYRLEQLGQINAQLDAWTAYWAPVLSEAQNKGDPLAYTVVQTLAQFVILAVNGAVYTRWELERKAEMEQGKEGRPTLTKEDWQHLQRAADAADNAIFVVSTEATLTGHPLRECRWPEPVNGQREALHLDPRITEDFKTALDTMTCIAFVYSLIFLVRMASAGLITCDLTTRQSDYEAGCDLSVPQPLATGTKLARLLALGSHFLTGISPNPDHPCCRHALLVEMILRVGLSATTPGTNGSSPAAAMGGKGDKRSPASMAMGGPPAPPQRSATYPFPAGQPLPTQSSTSGFPPPSMNLPPHLQPGSAQPLPPIPVGGPSSTTGSRPSISSFDSWLWDTTNPSTAAAALSGPLRMVDGSLVMPDLAAAASPSPGGVEQPPRPTSRASGSGGSVQPLSSADRAAALAMVAGAGRGGGAGQAIANLLSEVNPFYDSLDVTEPSLGLASHSWNDNFGLALDSGMGLAALEWMPPQGGPGGVEEMGAGLGGGFEGGANWPFSGGL
ncbi:hypothetical protein JCM8547_006838 [Rhodosporidiobolus lusitaniae]